MKRKGDTARFFDGGIAFLRILLLPQMEDPGLLWRGTAGASLHQFRVKQVAAQGDAVLMAYQGEESAFAQGRPVLTDGSQGRGGVAAQQDVVVT